MLKEHITLMLVPEGQKDPFRLRLSMGVFWALVVIFALLAALFILGSFMGAKYVGLYIENKKLTAQLAHVNEELAKTNEIRARLAEIGKLERMMRGMLGQTPNEKTDERESLPANLSSFPGQLAQRSPGEPTSDYIPRGLPHSGRISVSFGQKSPLLRAPHSGVDIPAPVGTPVFSTASGVVIAEGYDNELGFHVAIDHLNGYITRYGHLSQTTVEPGQQIERNSIVGFSGQSGRSMGAHIHYEVERNGKIIDPRGIEADSTSVAASSCTTDVTTQQSSITLRKGTIWQHLAKNLESLAT